jgi:site-specific DNA recombinase
MTIAIVYARVSTSRQMQKELPIAGQIEQCLRKAQEIGATVVAQFIDSSSGRSDNRKGFQEAISFCESHQVDFFITWSNSRFARNVADATRYKLRLHQAKTKLVYVSMSVDDGTDAGFLMDAMMDVMSEMTARTVAADTMRSMKRNAEQGFWNGGTPPFGFRSVPDPVNPKRRRLVANESEVIWVRQMFGQRLGGMGAKVLAQWLNSQGVENRGKKWTKAAVLNVLRSRAVIGQTVFGRKSHYGVRVPEEKWVVTQSHEPVIDIETWTMAQRMMDDALVEGKHGRVSGKYLLTGLLRCGQCGSTMCAELVYGRGKRVYVYYLCRTKGARDSRACSQKRIRVSEIEDLILDFVVRRVITVEYFREIVSQFNAGLDDFEREKSLKVKKLAAEVNSLRQANENLLQILESGRAMDGANFDVMMARIADNSLRIKALEGERQVIESTRRNVLDFSDEDLRWRCECLRDLIMGADVARKRCWLKSFVREIRVSGETLEVIYSESLLVNSSGREMFRLVDGENEGWLPDVSTWRNVFVELRSAK